MRLALINRTGGLEFLEDHIRAACPGTRLAYWPSDAAREAEVAICWDPPDGTLADMPNLRLVHSIGAGVDRILADPTLPDIPVCRIRDDDLAVAMGEYCHWATLWFHRGLDTVTRNAAAGHWHRFEQRPASQVPVCVLGLGDTGRHVAGRLRDAGYPVRGWSRSPHEIPGVVCHAGPEALPLALADAQVVICLLPLTPDTTGILGHATLSALPPGAGVVLCSRGEHLDRAALVTLLHSGHLRGAVLDVFPQEPLPADDPLWHEPGVLVTPHMSALAKPRRIVAQIAENLRRLDRGDPLLNRVDRARGY